jgi:hypothetical protein
MLGDDRQEKGAFADLPPDFLIPCIAAAQLIPVEPNLDALAL